MGGIAIQNLTSIVTDREAFYEGQEINLIGRSVHPGRVLFIDGREKSLLVPFRYQSRLPCSVI
jgi:hypothetical protein